MRSKYSLPLRVSPSPAIRLCERVSDLWRGRSEEVAKMREGAKRPAQMYRLQREKGLVYFPRIFNSLREPVSMLATGRTDDGLKPLVDKAFGRQDAESRVH